MKVSSDDPRRPYVQIADDLRAAIKRGKYKPGGKLPSARMLAKEYGVALQTINNATNLLKNEGIVVSSGTVGLFVQSDSEPLADEAHSPEYEEIMRHLDSVQAAVTSLTARVADLEENARRDSSKQSTRPRRAPRQDV